MTTDKRAELKERINSIIDKARAGLHPSDATGAILTLVDQYTTTVAEEAQTHTVNRFEVINHMSDGSGRQVTVWHGEPFKVEPSLQDDGRTLKIFLTDIEQLTKSKEANQ